LLYNKAPQILSDKEIGETYQSPNLRNELNCTRCGKYNWTRSRPTRKSATRLRDWNAAVELYTSLLGILWTQPLF